MNDKPTIDDLLDTYYDKIKQGDELITSIQKDTKQQIERMIIEAKISILKSVRNKPHGGEDKSREYIDGYNESQGKIAFEIQRLEKRLS